MVELSRRAALKTQQAVTEYLARTGGGPGGLDALRDGTMLLGKTLEAISAGSTGTVQVYAASRVKDTEVAKGDEEASGDTARQYECYSRGHDFADDEWCIILRLGGTGLEIIPFSGGAGGSCPEVHEISTTGSPSAGSADLTYDLLGSDTITINYDDTAAEVVTAFETHSSVSAGDVACTGGPLPAVAINVIFQNNLAGVAFNLPTISDSITNGDLRMRKAASYDWTA